ncbi:MAG TPA: hypothetical protein VNT53_00145 [Pseudolysinimonas sp.]|nr:hypothetical protein [Pseudolysinimonas sp.]
MTQQAHPSGMMRQKTRPPGLPTMTVRRPRLDALYDAILADRDTIVVFAGAGSGKTVQTQLYAEGAGLPMAWLTLDRYDRSPSRMISYLARSIAPFAPGAEEIAERALADLPADEVAVMLAEAIEGTQPFLLVLDQLEWIEDSPSSCDALQAFLEFRPQDARAILMARTEVQFSIGRWVLQGRAGRVDDGTLALTSDEARELSGAMGVGAEESDALLRSSGGWLAGFAFDSVLIDGAAASSDFSAYLTVEVLDRMSPAERAFFLDVSVLDAVGLTAAEAVHGSGARAVWASVRAMHLPMTVTAEQELVFHPCFRDFLIDRLETEHPGRRSELQIRHAELLTRDGDAEHGVELLLAEGLMDAAADLAGVASASVLGRGDSDAVLRWVQALGQDRVRQRPALSGAMLRALVGARRTEAARELALELDSAGLLRDVISADQSVVSHIVWSLLWHPAEARDILQRYDYHGAAAEARFAIDVVSGEDAVSPPGAGSWSDNDRLVSWALMLQGRVGALVDMLPLPDHWPPSSPFTTPHPIMGLLWQGDIARAHELLAEVPEETRQRIHPVLWLFLDTWMHIVEKRPADALSAAERGVVLCRRMSDGMRPVFQVLQGAALLALGRVEDAERELDLALATTRLLELRAYSEWADTFRAIAILRRGNVESARATLREVVAAMQRSNRRMLLPLAAAALAECDRLVGDEPAAQLAATLAGSAADETQGRWLFAFLGDILPSTATPAAVTPAITTEPREWAETRLVASDVVISDVRIQPFGATPDIIVDGVPMGVRRLKVLELAALLCLHPSGVSRESMQLRLFPESDRGKSGNYFRQIVHNMRSATTLTLSRAANGNVGWDERLRVVSDDVEFEQRVHELSAEEPEDGMQARAELLALAPAAYLVRSDLEWADERRYTIDSLREELASDLAMLALKAGEWDLVRSSAELALAINPYSEAVHRALIEAELAAGRGAAAKAAARRLAQTLDALGQDPDDRTAQVMRRAVVR